MDGSVNSSTAGQTIASWHRWPLDGSPTAGRVALQSAASRRPGGSDQLGRAAVQQRRGTRSSAAASESSKAGGARRTATSPIAWRFGLRAEPKDGADVLRLPSSCLGPLDECTVGNRSDEATGQRETIRAGKSFRRRSPARRRCARSRETEPRPRDPVEMTMRGRPLGRRSTRGERYARGCECCDSSDDERRRLPLPASR